MSRLALITVGSDIVFSFCNWVIYYMRRIRCMALLNPYHFDKIWIDKANIYEKTTKKLKMKTIFSWHSNKLSPLNGLTDKVSGKWEESIAIWQWCVHQIAHSLGLTPRTSICLTSRSRNLKMSITRIQNTLNYQ